MNDKAYEGEDWCLGIGMEWLNSYDVMFGQNLKVISTWLKIMLNSIQEKTLKVKQISNIKQHEITH